MAFDINDRSTWAWIDQGTVTESWADDAGYAINPKDRHSFYHFVDGVANLHRCAWETTKDRQVFNPMRRFCDPARNVSEAEIYNWAIRRGLVKDQRRR